MAGTEDNDSPGSWVSMGVEAGKAKRVGARASRPLNKVVGASELQYVCILHTHTYDLDSLQLGYLRNRTERPEMGAANLLFTLFVWRGSRHVLQNDRRTLTDGPSCFLCPAIPSSRLPIVAQRQVQVWLKRVGNN